MSLRILVAEDDPVLRAVASGVLRAEGFTVMETGDGQAALEAFQHERPDLVLTDYDMPLMDGLELTRHIRSASAINPVPVIMFTGGGRHGLLQESLDAGAIEFLTKPFSPDELRCRVKAIAELVSLHRDLAEAKAKDDEELAITKHVLTRLLEPGAQSRPAHCFMETLATQRINGDACSYRAGLPDVHYGLICDATGHGLTAGVSTIPVLEAFATMASRDIPLESIYAEINRKLRMMMPTGRFVCLALLRLDEGNGQLSVLNAGMPDIGLSRSGECSHRVIPSRNLPAGVITTPDIISVEDFDVRPGDRILACSDGATELLGEDFLAALLDEGMNVDFTSHLDQIRATLFRHLGDAELHDDASYALWEVAPPTLRPALLDAQAESIPEDLLLGLALDLRMDPRRHQVRDFLPQVMTLLGYEHLPPADARILALLLTEALTNAVDHGVLGISSDLKEEGFEAYEQERKERLSKLKDGYVRLRLTLSHDPLDQRVRMVEVEVEDTGPGFNWRKGLHKAMDFTKPSGRGLALLRALAREVWFNDAGNRVGFRLACG